MAKKVKRVKAGTRKAAAAERRRLFVEAMIENGGNATRAAIDAGFAPRSARVTGSQLLADPNIARVIAERVKEALDKAKLTSDEVLRNLACAVRFDPRKLYRDDGSLKDVIELDDETAMALAGIDVTEEFSNEGEGRELSGYTKKIKWCDKNVARDQALKYFKLLQGVPDDDGNRLTRVTIELSATDRVLVAAISGGPGGQIPMAGAERPLLPASIPAASAKG